MITRYLVSQKILHQPLLFKESFISVRQAEEICNLSKKAANDLVSLFVQQGILKEISGKTRYRLFLFESYLNLFK